MHTSSGPGWGLIPVPASLESYPRVNSLLFPRNISVFTSNSYRSVCLRFGGQGKCGPCLNNSHRFKQNNEAKSLLKEKGDRSWEKGSTETKEKRKQKYFSSKYLKVQFTDHFFFPISPSHNENFLSFSLHSNFIISFL